jgi:hypothetical protein
MSTPENIMSRRRFCLCCTAATYLVASRFSFGPRAAYAAAGNLVDKIRDAAANTPITVHKLRRNVRILEGSGGNIAGCSLDRTVRCSLMRASLPPGREF